MALRRRHGQREQLLFLTVLPITPLVDVSLMLVVFMLLGMRSAENQSLPVALPKAGTGTAAVQSTLTITIDVGGGLRVDGTAIEFARLGTVAKGHTMATLNADTAVTHGRVVAVVDALRKAGVDKIYYATVPGVVEW